MLGFELSSVITALTGHPYDDTTTQRHGGGVPTRPTSYELEEQSLQSNQRCYESMMLQLTVSTIPAGRWVLFCALVVGKKGFLKSHYRHTTSKLSIYVLNTQVRVLRSTGQDLPRISPAE